MKTYHLRGKNRREAKVFLKRVQDIAKAIQSPLGRWAWHMAKQKYFAFHAPVPKYPSGTAAVIGGELLVSKDTYEVVPKPEVLSEIKLLSKKDLAIRRHHIEGLSERLQEAINQHKGK